jgi:small subunit ribosomal protein S17
LSDTQNANPDVKSETSGSTMAQDTVDALRPAGHDTEAPAGRGKRKTRVGIVVSDKMDKTVVVAVERITTHPLYRKRVKRTSKFKAHDENNICREGDKVKIAETRPLSKEKHWRVVEVIEQAK